MAVSLPQSFSMEMLSRLPPQSFELEYREIRPDVEQNGGVYPVDRDSKVTFHIRSATNEVVLNQGIEIQGQVSCTLDYGAGTNATSGNYPQNVPANGYDYEELMAVPGRGVGEHKKPKWRRGMTFIKSSRESFNAGALPYLDNQNTGIHLHVNNMRSQCAKRHVDLKDTWAVNDDAVRVLGAERGFSSSGGGRLAKVAIDDLHGAGWDEGVSKYHGLNAKWQDATNATKYYLAPPKKFSAPLGLYSSLVNTPSVIPTGLLSAYSVNGWSIEVTLAKLTGQSQADSSVVVNTESPSIHRFSNSAAYNSPVVSQNPGGVDFGDGYRNVRIVVPVVKILDPAVMTGILDLYEKRESVNVGGASFPMSLRFNSLGHRYFNFGLTNIQADYSWRIPTTDRSVRALHWYLFDTAKQEKVESSVEGRGINTRLELRAGSLRPFPPVEDREPRDQNLPSFYALQKRRSGHCFSPFPYYLEAIKRDENQSDVDLSLWPSSSSSYRGVSSGVISLENLDYREPDYSSSFQASGYDMTNVGGFDINMRFSHLNPSDAGNSVGTSTQGPAYQPGPGGAEGSWQIVFVMAYDSVHECSPSGVVDITSSVL